MQQVLLDTISQLLNQPNHIWLSLDNVVLVGNVAYNVGLGALMRHALDVKCWTPPPPPPRSPETVPSDS